MGFTGVVISDDLDAAQVKQDILPASGHLVLTAGCTLVRTVTAAVLPAMIDPVLTLAKQDAAFAERVDAAVRTALLAKAARGLLG